MFTTISLGFYLPVGQVRLYNYQANFPCIRNNTHQNMGIVLLYNSNVVSTVNVGCRLDLKEIAIRTRNAEYNPKVIGYY